MAISNDFYQTPISTVEDLAGWVLCLDNDGDGFCYLRGLMADSDGRRLEYTQAVLVSKLLHEVEPELFRRIILIANSYERSIIDIVIALSAELGKNYRKYREEHGEE